MASPSGSGTVVREPVSTHLVLWAGFPLAGTALGAAVVPVAHWAVTLPWVPYEGPIRTIATFSGFWPMVVATVVGLVAGLVLGVVGSADNLVVTVSDEEVTLGRGDQSHTFPRSAVAGVFRDRREVVLLGHADDELARERTDITEDALRPVFEKHGFSWLVGGDPYRDDFSRWVPEAPAGLPAGVNALLKARDRALRKDDKHDIADLRRELAKLGIVVRDEKKRQYWRRSRRAVDDAPEASA